jgi:signal transduction histidine kinase
MRRTRYYKCPVLLVLLLGGLSTLHSQDSTSCIDISKISYVRSISKLVDNGFIGKNESLSSVLAQTQFQKGVKFTGTIPSDYVTKKGIYRFSVCNGSDSAGSIWFFPGFYYWDVILYRQQGNHIIKLPSEKLNQKDNLGFRKITLGPHDSAVLYAELYFVKTYINTLRPRLINSQRVEIFMTDVRSAHDRNNVVTYLFCGLMLMMILFSIATYVNGGNKEFLYYSGYAFFVGGMLFTKALYDFRPNTISFFFEGYLDFIMLCIGHGFYMLFMRRFLVTRWRHPFLYRLYNFGIIMLMVSIPLYTFSHYFTNNYTIEYWTENITKFILLIMTIVFLVYSLRQWKDKIFRWVFWGNFFLFIFSLMSTAQVLGLIHIKGEITGNSLFYYEMGLFLELVFFLVALNHKNNRRIISETRERERLKTDNQLKEYEKEIAVYKAQQEERQRISADMHDELGAGMTAIRLMSEIARNKMKESTPVEIERISHSADEVLNKMNAIIWSMNSGNDTLDNLVSYIRSYAIEYFENTQVECKVNTPEHIDPTELTGDKRRNLFLCVKETLNNALKHSGASQIVIDFEINQQLMIRIADNGVGIDLLKIRQFGNGLKNITRRMESIGGTYHIENKNGTVTTLTLPL